MSLHNLENHHSEDRFFYSGLANDICYHIKRYYQVYDEDKTREAPRLGLFGKFGSGKSWVVEKIRIQLEGEQYAVKVLDVWMMSEMEIRFQFDEKIQDSADSREIFKFLHSVMKDLPKEAKTAAWAMFPGLFVASDTIFKLLSTKFAPIVSYKENRYKPASKTVLVLENMDRCTVAQKRALLSALYNHRNEIAVPVIVPIDPRVGGADGEYFEDLIHKVFHWYDYLPIPDRDASCQYFRDFFPYEGIVLTAELEEMLRAILPVTPRELIHIRNNIGKDHYAIDACRCLPNSVDSINFRPRIVDEILLLKALIQVLWRPLFESLVHNMYFLEFYLTEAITNIHANPYHEMELPDREAMRINRLLSAFGAFFTDCDDYRYKLWQTFGTRFETTGPKNVELMLEAQLFDRALQTLTELNPFQGSAPEQPAWERSFFQAASQPEFLDMLCRTDVALPKKKAMFFLVLRNGVERMGEAEPKVLDRLRFYVSDCLGGDSKLEFYTRDFRFLLNLSTEELIRFFTVFSPAFYQSKYLDEIAMILGELGSRLVHIKVIQWLDTLPHMFPAYLEAVRNMYQGRQSAHKPERLIERLFTKSDHFGNKDVLALCALLVEKDIVAFSVVMRYFAYLQEKLQDNVEFAMDSDIVESFLRVFENHMGTLTSTSQRAVLAQSGGKILLGFFMRHMSVLPDKQNDLFVMLFRLPVKSAVIEGIEALVEDEQFMEKFLDHADNEVQLLGAVWPKLMHRKRSIIKQYGEKKRDLFCKAAIEAVNRYRDTENLKILRDFREALQPSQEEIGRGLRTLVNPEEIEKLSFPPGDGDSWQFYTQQYAYFQKEEGEFNFSFNDKNQLAERFDAVLAFINEYTRDCLPVVMETMRKKYQDEEDHNLKEIYGDFLVQLRQLN